MNNVHIALAMIVKDESERIHVTLKSISTCVNSLVIYDTGSTDNTIKIIEQFSEEYKIPLHLKQGEFIDFSTSRNLLLDFANEFVDIDFLLQLDANDELIGGDKLREYCIEKKDSIGFFIYQEWWYGKYERYSNIRLIKNRSGWYYTGSVHEYISNPDDSQQLLHLPESIIIYQDRTQDNGKSSKRFLRDEVLLLKEHTENPSEPRTVFYLAQTYVCLGEKEKAIYYYKLRLRLKGFWEEIFFSYLQLGDLSRDLGYPWSEIMGWYLCAFENFQRVEPILRICKYYCDKNQYLLSYTFAKLACILIYPTNCLLFIDKISYDYERWHMLGRVSYYVKQYNDGIKGCVMAINFVESNPHIKGIDKNIDKKNLEFYK